ncbi:MAG: SMP-30/gluconolactonase/LRE family protein [Verrucomicrobiota bacterium]
MTENMFKRLFIALALVAGLLVMAANAPDQNTGDTQAQADKKARETAREQAEAQRVVQAEAEKEARELTKRRIEFERQVREEEKAKALAAQQAEVLAAKRAREAAVAQAAAELKARQAAELANAEKIKTEKRLQAEAQRKAKADAEAAVKAEEQAKKRAQKEAAAKAEADRLNRIDSRVNELVERELKARRTASAAQEDAWLKAEADRQQKEAAAVEIKAKIEADRVLKLETEKKVRADAELARHKIAVEKQAQLAAESKAKADAEKQVKADAEKAAREIKARAEAEKKAKAAQTQVAKIPPLGTLKKDASPGSSSTKSVKNVVKTPPVKKVEPPKKPKVPTVATIGTIERLDPALDKLIPRQAVIEKLADGFKALEGAVWMGGRLLFSDVQENVIYEYEEGVPVTVFQAHSGYTGSAKREGELGSSGLTRDTSGSLVICQQGDRRIVRMESDGRLVPLAEYYRQRRFNSPCEAVFKSNGDMYFTDPPEGLEKRELADANGEMPFSGIYCCTKKGEIKLLCKEMSRPTGLVFSPDQKTLYVANSDPTNAVIMAFAIQRDGSLDKGRVFFDANELVKSGKKGLPEGLKVDRKGNLFATGPGGVLVISSQGKLLGVINTGEATANCSWGNGGNVLYITANQYLGRLKTATSGER